MNSSIRHSSQLIIGFTVCVCALTVGFLFLQFRSSSQLVKMPVAKPTPVAANALTPLTSTLSTLATQLVPTQQSNQLGELARRFRLAGTILGVSNSGANDPIAIIDDRVAITQRIIRRGAEVIPGVTLTQVRTSSIVLIGPAGSEELFLEKTSGASASVASTGLSGAESSNSSHLEARFGGKEVFPGRWEFRREALLDYYAELRDQPERLLSIFDSMDPVYVTDLDGERRITGYVVGVEGEADFFKASGLKNGDIVRSVNSVAMSNRRRAEGFIASFVEGNATTFVLEVERDGKTDKQVYVVE